MKKIYHLATCNTCQKIIKNLDLENNNFEFQNIKVEKITPEQLDEMHAMSGSYESLFSRRAMKFRSMGLGDKNLTEKDYRDLILDEYTFLKRPVIIVENEISIGSAKAAVEKAAKAIQA